MVGLSQVLVCSVIAWEVVRLGIKLAWEVVRLGVQLTGRTTSVTKTKTTLFMTSITVCKMYVRGNALTRLFCNSYMWSQCKFCTPVLRMAHSAHISINGVFVHHPWPLLAPGLRVCFSLWRAGMYQEKIDTQKVYPSRYGYTYVLR